MSSPPPPQKKLPWVKLAAVLAVVAAAAILLLRGFDFREWVDLTMEMIKDAGPAVFFTAMAVLPILPFPMLTFTLTAGTAFRDQLGLPLVLALSVLCVTVNFILTYSLARWLMRPVVERIMTRFGYSIPRIPDANVIGAIIIFRVTPGIPFPIQNYLLGLASVPFGRFVLVSFLAASCPSMAYVVFGDALINGNGRIVLASLGVIVGLMFATHLIRKHFAAKAQAKP